MKNQNEIKISAFIALFTAIISVGCVMAIPLPGGVPISLQNFFCVLAGCILGTYKGFFAVLLWMILGAIGVPVFASAHAGLGVLLGPTGGYIAGYALASLFAGLLLGSPKIEEKSQKKSLFLKTLVVVFFSYALVYVPGIPRFMSVMAANGKPQTFQNALSMTFIPFIPGDLIKFFVTVSLSLSLRPIAARYLFPPKISEEETALKKIAQKNQKEEEK